jgi:hypothetical protein
VEEVFGIMGQMVGTALCQRTFEALTASFRGLEEVGRVGRGRNGETVVGAGVIEEPVRIPGARLVLFPGGSVKVVGAGLKG